MANKIEKGQGGKRGHSNKDNWMTHQEEKALGRRLRRLEAKKIVLKSKKLPEEE